MKNATGYTENGNSWGTHYSMYMSQCMYRNQNMFRCFQTRSGNAMINQAGLDGFELLVKLPATGIGGGGGRSGTQRSRQDFAC